MLASTINWEAVAQGRLKIRGVHFHRFRVFGTFLETYELPEALSWDVIDQTLALVGQHSATEKRFVRSCLLQLGNVLAERRLIEDRESQLTKCGIRRSLERTPDVFVLQISDFQQWLAEGQVNPNLGILPMKTERLSIALRTMAETVNILARFLDFCATRNTVSLGDIGPSLVGEYQQNLLWEFECTKCQNRVPFNSSTSPRECIAAGCGAIDCYVRTRRLAQRTLISYVSVLRVFFDWAKLKKLVTDNPISDIRCGGARRFTVRSDSGEMIEVAEAIRRYDDIVVERLCAYIVSSDADPEDAIILYLIIFHFLSNAELRNLRIPSLVEPGSGLVDASKCADDFKYLHLPLRRLTRGNSSVIRTDTKILFPRKALSWLNPILQRHYEKRAGLIKCQPQEYFLVGEETGFCNKPMTRNYVTRRVRIASIRALGAVVKPSDLRRTAADMFAQRSKRRGAILTKMGFSPLSAIRFNYLERFTVEPRKVHSSDN